MTTPHVRAASRRALLAGACAACAAALAGCARYDSNNGGGIAGGAPAQSGASAQSSTGSSAAGPASPNAPAVLASTTDIPVGGGKILPGQKIVITQPHAGSFDAFTAVCTHQGCLVATVSGGTINCPCHGSKFSIADGGVKGGPAPKSLPTENVTVKNGNIVLSS